MIISKGYQRKLLTRVFNAGDDRNLILYSGTMPTKEEMLAELDTFTGTETGLAYYYRGSPLNTNAWLVSRGCTRLGYTRYINTATYIDGPGGVYEKDYTSNIENLVVEAEGTIGFVIEFQDEDTRNLLHTYAPGIAFYTVGLPGSGADVELTSLDVTTTSNIRLNKFSVGVA